MVNANAGIHKIALRIGYVDLNETYSRICTTQLEVLPARHPYIRDYIQLPDATIQCGQTFTYEPHEFIDARKIHVNLWEAEEFLFYDEDKAIVFTKSHVVTGKHVGTHLVVIEDRTEDTELISYFLDLKVNCI